MVRLDSAVDRVPGELPKLNWVTALQDGSSITQRTQERGNSQSPSSRCSPRNLVKVWWTGQVSPKALKLKSLAY